MITNQPQICGSLQSISRTWPSSWSTTQNVDCPHLQASCARTKNCTMNKDHLTQSQARRYNSSRLLPSCATLPCSSSLHSWWPTVQELEEENTMCIPKFHQHHLACRLQGLALLFHTSSFHTINSAFNVGVKGRTYISLLVTMQLRNSGLGERQRQKFVMHRVVSFQFLGHQQ
jgi:hypothetical protein